MSSVPTDSYYDDFCASDIMNEISDNSIYSDEMLNSAPAPEELSQHNAWADSKFRSVAAVAHSTHPALDGPKEHFVMPMSMVAPPSLVRNNAKAAISVSAPALSVFASSSSLPPQPFFVVPTHFACNFDTKAIVAQVDECLRSFHEVTFEYNADNYQWNAVFVRGSVYVKFTVHIYSNHQNQKIVEVNRLKGNATAFYQVYHALKNQLSVCTKAVPQLDDFNHLTVTSSIPEMNMMLNEAEINSAIAPLIRMAEENLRESQETAAHILCDLTAHDGFQHQLCDSGCIQMLSKLIDAQCDHTKRFAMIALSNLSESHVCQPKIIDAGAVSSLLSSAVDGSYETAETRRASARILANLSCRFSHNVVSSVNKEALFSWLNQVDRISDEKLRIHADRAKSALLAAF